MAIKPSLLIVEDEKTSREGLRAALEDRFEVYVAEDAASATQLLEEEHFDVMLTDFRLPNEDGMKLIKRAKALPKYSAARIAGNRSQLSGASGTPLQALNRLQDARAPSVPRGLLPTVPGGVRPANHPAQHSSLE